MAEGIINPGGHTIIKGRLMHQIFLLILAKLGRGGGRGYLPSSTQIHRPWVERQGLVGPEMSSKANNILTREIAAGFSP